MKLCAAQTRAVKGDIQSNITNHLKLIDLAVLNGVAIIIFPELSLTGYEPAMAKELATESEDSRFDVFQKTSDTQQIPIGVGMPTKSDAGICISMILFQPQQARKVYAKRYIHPDEESFFVSGQNKFALSTKQRQRPSAMSFPYPNMQQMLMKMEPPSI